METFRCPTCIAVLTDVNATRCPTCGQNIRRRRPRILGENTRIGATNLPIDRWMLERVRAQHRSDRRAEPVAWHGRFSTSPLAEPDFSATPPPSSAPYAQSAQSTHSTTSVMTDVVAFDDEPSTPATVGALALDVFVQPTAPPAPSPSPIVAAPEPEPEPIFDDTQFSFEPSGPAVVAHEELDPDVRALVDELYEQARAELSGNDLAFFVPETSDDALPLLDDEPAEHFATEPVVEPRVETAPIVEESPAPRPAPTPAPANGHGEGNGNSASNANGRSGWVAAFVTDERKRRHQQGD